MCNYKPIYAPILIEIKPVFAEQFSNYKPHSFVKLSGKNFRPFFVNVSSGQKWDDMFPATELEQPGISEVSARNSFT